MEDIKTATPANIPAAPASPLECIIAKVVRWWLFSKGYDLQALPQGFAGRLMTDRDVLPEEIWIEIANQTQLEIGRDVVTICRYVQIFEIMHLGHLPPGNEHFFVDFELCPYSYVYRIVRLLDDMGVLANLGLKCRRVNNLGEIIYPGVEEAFAEAREVFLKNTYGLSVLDLMVKHISKLGEIYDYYPETVAEEFTDLDRARLITEQVYSVNPDLAAQRVYLIN